MQNCVRVSREPVGKHGNKRSYWNNLSASHGHIICVAAAVFDQIVVFKSCVSRGHFVLLLFIGLLILISEDMTHGTFCSAHETKKCVKRKKSEIRNENCPIRQPSVTISAARRACVMRVRQRFSTVTATRSNFRGKLG